jgi:cytochrome c oxidase assembly protein Cox11
MRADGQTAMMKLMVAFRNFTKAPKNYLDGAAYFRKICCFSCNYTKLSGTSDIRVPYICTPTMLLLLMVEK